MVGVREQNRAEVTARILAAAREHVAADGAGMSMRAVARDVGIVSSAIHRYFPTKEDLLTAMIIESFERLGAALAACPQSDPAATWTALARTLRDWARAHPNQFHLIYGTPLPGYVAPPETVPAATSAAAPFLQAGAAKPVPGFDDPALLPQTSSLVGDGLAADPSGAAAVLAELAALTGFLTLELGGHFVGSADPADALYAAVVARQVRTLGLD